MGKVNQKKAESLYGQAAAGQKDVYGKFGGLSDELNAEGKDYRTTAANYYKGVAAGGPQATAALAPQVEAVKRQYRIGREAIDRNAIRGGQRDRALRESNVAEGGDIGNLYTGRIDEALNQLANLGMFGTSAGLQATGGQGNTAYQMLGTGNAFGDLAQQTKAMWMQALKSAGEVGAGFAMRCSRDYKENITEFSDFDTALRMVIDQPLARFKYLEHIDQTHKHRFGIIVEDSNPAFTDGKNIDVVSTLGILMGAIKAQQNQIEDMKKLLSEHRS